MQKIIHFRPITVIAMVCATIVSPGGAVFAIEDTNNLYIGYTSPVNPKDASRAAHLESVCLNHRNLCDEGCKADNQEQCRRRCEIAFRRCIRGAGLQFQLAACPIDKCRSIEVISVLEDGEETEYAFNPLMPYTGPNTYYKTGLSYQIRRVKPHCEGSFCFPQFDEFECTFRPKRNGMEYYWDWLCKVVNAHTIYKGKALFNSIWEGDLAERLITSDTDVTLSDENGSTLLHDACLLNKVKIAETLLLRGAEVDATNKRKRTPLLEVMAQGQVNDKSSKTVDLLLKYGANVNIREGENRNTPLHLASREENTQKIVEMLLSHGAEVNAKNKGASTPLHGVASSEVAELLLSVGAVVDARNWKGATPLHFSRSQAVTEVLLAHGADANAKDNSGSTPLHETDIPDVVDVLVANGADVNARDKDKRTPLHLVRNNPSVAKALINHGANINAKDKDNRTPLHEVMKYDAVQPELIDFLIAQGADVNAQDNAGQTPLHRAVMNRHMGSDTRVSVVGLLLNHKANVKIKDRQGRTALMLARESGMDELESLLTRK